MYSVRCLRSTVHTYGVDTEYILYYASPSGAFHQRFYSCQLIWRNQLDPVDPVDIRPVLSGLDVGRTEIPSVLLVSTFPNVQSEVGCLNYTLIILNVCRWNWIDLECVILWSIPYYTENPHRYSSVHHVGYSHYNLYTDPPIVKPLISSNGNKQKSKPIIKSNSLMYNSPCTPSNSLHILFFSL